jgi:hypothetical protein
MRLWSLRNGATAPHNANATWGEFSPDSRMLVYPSIASRWVSGVAVWDMKTDAVQEFPISNSYPATQSGITLMGFSRDNKSVHFAERQTMKYWAVR